jgi:hypothetical protein
MGKEKNEKEKNEKEKVWINLASVLLMIHLPRTHHASRFTGAFTGRVKQNLVPLPTSLSTLIFPQ